MTAMISTPTACPACATPGQGRFCGNCGAERNTSHCTSCGAPLASGARFCSRCRDTSPVPAAAPRMRSETWVPWAMTGVALVLAAFVAGQRVGRGSPSPVAAPRTSLAARPVSNDGAIVNAPDISALSPRERVDRLYDRIMRLDAEGEKDSVGFFSNMAIPGYGMLPSMDEDLRYDLGRIEEVAGALVLARAQADTILRTNPTHLLGLSLGMRTARALDDTAGARAFGVRLLAANQSEHAKALPEYTRHAADIAAAVQEAKKK